MGTSCQLFSSKFKNRLKLVFLVLNLPRNTTLEFQSKIFNRSKVEITVFIQGIYSENTVIPFLGTY